jgi:predicted CXXCH cytochrome family protein
MIRRSTGCARFGILAPLILFVLLGVAAAPSHAAITSTKHNLSVSGPGSVRATGEAEVCVFCHAPHNTSPSGQLWNRRVGASYTPYTSSTLKSIAGQPNGASLLCLSCHDGTIALGEVRSRASTIGMAGGVTTMPPGDSLLGTDLSDDHPISFVYDATLASLRGELADPSTLVKPSKVRLDAGGRLQCTACHDPHDDTNAKFLVVANIASALCNTCHIKNYWNASDHRNAASTWNNAAPNPWPHTTGASVAANACENCHRPHTAGGGKRLLNYAAEEDNCYPCHNGNVAAKNVQAEFNKPSVHHVANYTGIHDPTESASVSSAHVECADCHNPHAANASAGSLPAVTTVPVLSGSQIGVRGIRLSGTAIDVATAEYEICFRCHADGAGNIPSANTARVIVQNNKRLEFQTTNPSFHPVAAAGRSSTVPSLIAPWTISSLVKCTDCHNNNTGPYSTGTGTTQPTPADTRVNGPHGSTYAPLLERQYATIDNTPESSAAYALCYKCHDQTNILSNAAGSFTSHNFHIVTQRTPCNVCHDPHGISATQGTVQNNSRLINFATSSVTRSGTEVIRWEQGTVPGSTTGGRCYLTCHGANHAGRSY